MMTSPQAWSTLSSINGITNVMAAPTTTPTSFVIVGFTLTTCTLHDGSLGGFNGVAEVQLSSLQNVPTTSNWELAVPGRACTVIGSINGIQKFGYKAGYALKGLVMSRVQAREKKVYKVTATFGYVLLPGELAGSAANQPDFVQTVDWGGLGSGATATYGDLTAGSTWFMQNFWYTWSCCVRRTMDSEKGWYDNRGLSGLNAVQLVDVAPFINVMNNFKTQPTTTVECCSNPAATNSIQYSACQQLLTTQSCDAMYASVCPLVASLKHPICRAWLLKKENAGKADAAIKVHCAKDNNLATDNFCACQRQIATMEGIPAGTLQAMNALPACWDDSCIDEGYKSTSQANPQCNTPIMKCIQRGSTSFDGTNLTGKVTFSPSAICTQYSTVAVAAAPAAPASTPAPAPPQPQPQPQPAPAPTLPTQSQPTESPTPLLPPQPPQPPQPVTSMPPSSTTPSVVMSTSNLDVPPPSLSRPPTAQEKSSNSNISSSTNHANVAASPTVLASVPTDHKASSPPEPLFKRKFSWIVISLILFALLVVGIGMAVYKRMIRRQKKFGPAGHLIPSHTQHAMHEHHYSHDILPVHKASEAHTVSTKPTPQHHMGVK